MVVEDGSDFSLDFSFLSSLLVKLVDVRLLWSELFFFIIVGGDSLLSRTSFLLKIILSLSNREGVSGSYL